MALHIDIVSSVCDQVAAWQQAFLGEANLDRFRRAAAWTMSEVAKGAAGGAKGAVEDAFENPTPWMRAAFGYQRALTRSGDEISAELFVKPSQSIVLKYALGDGVQTRRPGEVGLARERILVPHWRNLALTQGINRNSYGNLPGGGVAARLAREAAGTTAKRRVAGRWGVYRGELDVGGSRITGYIARPGARRPSARAAARSSSTSAGLGHCSSPSTRRGTAPSFRQAHGRRVAQLEQDADHRHECSKVQARPNDSICARS